MSTAYSAASVYIPPSAGVKAGTLQAWRPDVNLLQDIDVVQNTANASRVNQQGLIEFVPANTARWDWSDGGSCPKILVEPQRTNLYSDSNSFTAIGATITTGQESPTPAGNEGVLITADGASVQPRSPINSTALSSGNHVQSIRIKKGTNNFIALGFQSYTGATGTFFSYFDLNAGTTPTPGAKIKHIGNGWYICTSPPYNLDAGDLTGINTIFITPNTSNLNWPTAADANGKSVHVYEYQFEKGDYSTSAIKTSGAIATRNADVISKTGIASLIGQSEGTLFVRFKASVVSTEIIQLGDSNTNSIRIAVNGFADVLGYVYADNATINAFQSAINGVDNYVNVAIRYRNNDYAMSVNGNAAIKSTNGAFTPLSALDVLNLSSGGFIAGNKSRRIAKAAWWKTAFTDEELIDLTTP